MAEPMQISPEAQRMMLQMQTFQQQMQAIGMQKETFHIQSIEIDKALEELGKTNDDNEVFKAVGPILVKSTKKELEKDLKEKKESIDTRLKSLEKQETQLHEKVKETQGKIQEFLKARESKKESAS
jgi:prefoldin beta subunit